MSTKHSKSKVKGKKKAGDEEDQFKGINGTADTMEEALAILPNLICKWVKELKLPRDVYPEVERLLRECISIFPYYNTREEGRVVEAWGLFWAYRGNELLWSLKVIWDVDGQTMAKDGRTLIPPHYGYEIYLNGQRKPPGPGHVYIDPTAKKTEKLSPKQQREAAKAAEIAAVIDSVAPLRFKELDATNATPFWVRDAKPMREIQKGIYAEQILTGAKGPSQIRLDHALRMWGLGLDRELFDEEDPGFNLQEYYEWVHRAPKGWGRFDKPSFGRESDAFDRAFDELAPEEKASRRADFTEALVGEELMRRLRESEDAGDEATEPQREDEY